MEDEVEYELPLGLLGRLAAPLVSRALTRIFAFRQQRVAALLANPESESAK